MIALVSAESGVNTDFGPPTQHNGTMSDQQPPPWPGGPTPPPGGGPSGDNPYGGPAQQAGGPHQVPYPQQPHPPVPYGVPGAGWQPPRKPRPSGWWWLGPVGLVLVSMALGAIFFGLLFVNLLRNDAEIPTDGQPHAITLPDTKPKAIWLGSDDAYAGCKIIDTTTGERITFTMVDITGQTLKPDDYGQDIALKFTPPSREITATCKKTGDLVTSLRVGPAPVMGDFVRAIALGAVVPFVLGSIGVVWGIVLIVLMVKRPARNAGS